jgi:hypothetical protein
MKGAIVMKPNARPFAVGFAILVALVAILALGRLCSSPPNGPAVAAASRPSPVSAGPHRDPEP